MESRLKIIIACDSFKESLSTFEVAEAVEEGIRMIIPDAQIEKTGIADGGEGTADVITNMLKGDKVAVSTLDPLYNRIKGWYGAVDIDGTITAVIDVATATGLSLVPVEERNPMVANSYGTGSIIRNALTRGIRNFIIGLGGSATIDCGIGILSALGYVFLDKDGREIDPLPRNMISISDIIEPKDSIIDDCQFVALSDVTTRLTGKNGCAYVFGAQKGASLAQMEDLNRGLENMLKIIRRKKGIDLNDYSGSGAAGGIGGVLIAFLRAEIKEGAREILKLTDFSEKIKGASFVITGEGCIDVTTKMGKAPYIIMQEALRYDVPTIGICGSVKHMEADNQSGFACIFPIVPGPTSLNEALNPEVSRKNIHRTVAQIIKLYQMSRAM